MESSSGDVGGSGEDIPARSKKSKLKSLRSRLLGKSKRTGEERHATLSQSASDITAGEELGSDEDLACSHGVMGSRAFSHDSIFLDDEVLTEAEPARVSSQENVHSKIKALQIKLQQQKMHLGPPPLVLPVRRPEDVGSHVEVDGRQSELSSQGVFSKNTTQTSSPPLSLVPVPGLAKHVAPNPSRPSPAPAPAPAPSAPAPAPPSAPSAPSAPSVPETALDLGSPAQFTPCLDTSAARHRMSVKPRNQRASTKKRVATTDSRLPPYTPNNSDHTESVKEEEPPHCDPDKETLEDQSEADVIITAPRVPSPKSPDVEPVASEASAKSSSLTLSQQEPAPPCRAPPVSSQVLRVKPQRPAGAAASERPHSSFIESELKSRRDFEIQVMPYERRNTLRRTEDSSEKVLTVASSTATVRPSAVPWEVQDETETTKGLSRPAPGSGSSHFSITTAKDRDEARPRSSSFVGIREQAEATREGSEEKSSSSLKQEGAPPKTSVLQWDKRSSLKTTSSASKNAATDTSGSAREEVEKSQREVKRKLEEVERSQREVKRKLEEVERRQKEEVKRNQEEVERSLKEVERSQREVERNQREVKRSQDEVEEAVEAQEDVQEEEEAKLAFGIKLRATSQSRRFQRDVARDHLMKPPLCEDHHTTHNKQEVGVSSSSPSTSEEVRVTDPAPSGFSLPVKNNLPPAGDSHVRPAEVREAEAVLPEPQPQTASSEVSWMSLALEKTRSLQQLITSRLPRDFAGASRQEVQPTNQTEPQASANTPSTDSAKAATVQTIKASQVSVHQKTSVMSPALSKAFSDAQTPPSHPHDQTKSWTAQSSLRSCTQSESSSATHCPAQPSPSLGQQPPRSNRVLQQTIQPKSTTLVSSPSLAIAAPPPPPPGGEREGSAQEKEAPSSSDRRAARGGSVIMRAAFLERRAEKTFPAVSKEVDLKKVQTEAQTLDESLSWAKTTPVSTDTKPEGRQALKPAESTPTERPHEDKWIRRNVAPSSPSSSPTQSTTVVQSMSGRSQPSWMELAKRKSMAWSDKTMD